MVNNMKYYISSKKLQLVVNELGEEYKDLLIEKMLDDYQTTDIDSLPISELLKLDVSIKERLVENKQFKKRKRLYNLLASLGLVYSMLGIFLLFFQELERSFSTEPMNMLALSFIMIGLFVSFYGIMLKNITLKRRSYRHVKNDFQNGYEFVSLWKELEGLMIQLSPDNTLSSPSKLIQYLSENKFISEKDESSIKTLLKLRNETVHSTTSPRLELTHEEYSSLVKNIRSIITKLNNLI
jgi:hypothetical protein